MSKTSNIGGSSVQIPSGDTQKHRALLNSAFMIAYTYKEIKKSPPEEAEAFARKQLKDSSISSLITAVVMDQFNISGSTEKYVSWGVRYACNTLSRRILGEEPKTAPEYPEFLEVSSQLMVEDPVAHLSESIRSVIGTEEKASITDLHLRMRPLLESGPLSYRFKTFVENAVDRGLLTTGMLSQDMDSFPLQRILYHAISLSLLVESAMFGKSTVKFEIDDSFLESLVIGRCQSLADGSSIIIGEAPTWLSSYKTVYDDSYVAVFDTGDDTVSVVVPQSKDATSVIISEKLVAICNKLTINKTIGPLRRIALFGDGSRLESAIENRFNVGASFKYEDLDQRTFDQMRYTVSSMEELPDVLMAIRYTYDRGDGPQALLASEVVSRLEKSIVEISPDEVANELCVR